MTETQILSLTPSICYKDPKAAMQWLQDAFGFEIAVLLTDANGDIAHLDMRAGAFSVGVMGEWSTHKSAPTLGATTCLIGVDLADDVDAHCQRARAAGAV